MRSAIVTNIRNLGGNLKKERSEISRVDDVFEKSQNGLWPFWLKTSKLLSRLVEISLDRIEVFGACISLSLEAFWSVY